MKKLLLLLICFSVIVSAQITGQYIQVIPSTNASTTGTLGFFEKSNAASAHFVGFAAPDVVAADVRWILPAVDGSPGQALITNGAKVLSWGAGGGGGSSPPFIDSTSISFNAVDPSKFLKFDLSRITTATTRKMLPQDFDTVVAGTNLNNYWSAHQLLVAHNTYDLGSSSDGWRWGYFATGVDIANGKITIDASSPQIDASNLGTNLKIQGSNIANGNIFLTPGNVAGSSSVRIETARTDIPALIIKQAAGNQSTEIFQIQDSTGLALFGIRGAGVGGGSNNSVAVAGNIAPYNNNLYSLGLSPNRFSKLWVTDIDLSGTCTGCPSGGGAPFPDNAVLVVGATDATKKSLIENSRVTPGFTRKIIPQDFDTVVAGTNLNNYWSVDQLPLTDNVTNLGSAAAQWRSGYFGTAVAIGSGKLLFQSASPQFNGASLGTAFVIQGSLSGNGDIYIVPGNIGTAAGSGRFLIQASRADIPTLIITQPGSLENSSTPFLILDHLGSPYFSVNGGAAANPYAVNAYGSILPIANITSSLGSNNTNRFNKLWVKDIDLSGTCTGCPTGGGSGAPFPDNSPIIVGAVDATKKLTIDLQRITSGTTRKSIPQDFDTVVAGTNINNFWSVAQLPINNNTIPLGSTSARFSKLWVTDIDLSGICTGCPGSSPFLDNSVIVVGATDATKKLIIENSRITSGTTRKMLPQDFDTVVAGTNINNFWSVAQLPINNNTIPIGSTTARFSKIWLTDADLTGTFTYPVVAYASCPSVFTTPWNVIATAGNRPTGCMQIRDSAARVWNAPVW